MPTRDSDIRSALYETELARYEASSDSRVLHEMGICQGEFRIDVAVVNGALHGYEIKSDRDTLVRLSAQSAAYGRVFDTVTLVVGTSHLQAALAVVPEWWRVLAAAAGAGGSTLRAVRTGGCNPAPDPLAVAQLLWRDELIAILEQCQAPRKLLRRPKWELWPALVSLLEPEELGARVRTALKQRQRWRTPPDREAASPPSSGGATSPPRATSADFRPA